VTDAPLIPPRKMRRLDGRLELADGLMLASPRRADTLALRQLAEDLKAAGVRRVRVLPGEGPQAAVRVRRTPDVKQPEGYRLHITPEAATVEAATDAGAFYGLQTLRDLVQRHGPSLPCVTIDDHPDLARRGLYLDTARGKVPTLDTLKGLVHQLARWKYNELQLYIENNFAFPRQPEIGRGFNPLTAADLHELEAFAASHHVRLVGSLASFGHMELILRLPRYRSLGELPGHNGYPGGTTVSPADPGSMKLVTDLYNQFVPLLAAEDFNACGDEPWELGQGRSKRRAAKVGVGRVYVDFMKRVDRVCRSHGKRTNIWSDIVLEHPELLSDWPSDIVMLNWAYDAHDKRLGQSQQIADAGLPWVACPGTHGWGSHGSRLDVALRNVAVFAATARKLGAEGLLHTDWGDGGHRNPLAVSLCSIAHAGACAWNGRAVLDDAAFINTFAASTFGDTTGQLADGIRTLGGTCRHVDSRLGLYYSLREPIVGQRTRHYLRVDHARHAIGPPFDSLDPDKLSEAMGMLGPWRERSAWPEPASGDAWMSQAIDEFALAAELDHAACRRCRAGHRLRAGEAVDAAQWRAVRDEHRSLRQRFERVWLNANRPSRLRENLALFDAAVAEADRLSRD
jgi:hypothetical protein